MKRKIKIALFIVVMIIVAIVAACNIIVDVNASGRTYDSVSRIPSRETAVLLGTNPKSRYSKGRNFFYQARINATVKLYRAGKFRRVIISGAKRKDYDEPTAMKADLIKDGIPDSVISMDGNGHNTFLSMKNMRDRLHVDSIIVISQKWHNERAIFLADHLGMNAIGYDAADYNNLTAQITHIRELLARVKLFITVYITNSDAFK